MKATIVFLLLFTTFNYAQTWQETSTPANSNGQRYDDVFFLDEMVGWAANGYYSAVYKTIDGGLTWTEQFNGNDIPGNYYFRNIEFLDENIGFLGTLNGSFFKTTDGGDTWTEVTNISPNPNAICGLHAVNSTTIYGCGAYFSPAVVIKSIDSGDTWQHIDMSTYANALVEVLFVDANIGYASGRNDSGACILKTIDGGQNWTTIFSSNIIGEYVWKLQFINGNTNTIYGALYSVANNPGKIVKSFNAGNSWTSFDAPETGVQAIGFVNENLGWMGGHNTGFYETNDGGETWTNINIGSNLNRIIVLNEDLAFGCGTSVYKFTDESLSINSFGQDNDQLNLKIDTNPVVTELSVSYDVYAGDNIILELYDAQGKFVKRLKRETAVSRNSRVNYTFNISELSSGIYFLNLHNNLGQTALKFIKE
ncbi:YCF48-related protein [Ichthyenterobacterium sp. W332]|uniref:YCF48-related protein n=1 Tax=Microcosmobacter mediterraneus TaxID=3075607 RepID=A0ABU2YN93_9FLAO|nr:YCF48-related protein [Ichthyenterobacterium sp. W332]MDT0559640.1 YCF48-related protein [Ichthyenterobacterium sp. W332]